MSLLSRQIGTFSFERGDPPKLPPLGSLMTLVLEGSQLYDEWRRVARQIFAPVESVESVEHQGGHACMRALVRWADGARSVREIADLLSTSRSELLASVQAATQQGLLARVRGKEHEREKVLARALDLHGDRTMGELLETARAQLRGGDLESAAGILHVALARRPGDPIARQNLRHIAIRISGGRTRGL